MMGQAVGTAAVQSIKTGQPVNDLDTKELITTLRKWDANLPQNSLSKITMKKSQDIVSENTKTKFRQSRQNMTTCKAGGFLR